MHLLVETGGNIYSIDSGNVTYANTRIVNFDAGGFIEFRGIYTSSGALILSPGSAGINLRGATVTLNGAGNNFNANFNITLSGTNSNNRINAANITLGAITGGGNSLALNGITDLTGTDNSLGSLDVIGTSTIRGNIETTETIPSTAIGQRYSSTVTPGANVNFTGTAAGTNTVHFLNTVNAAGAFDLTVTNAITQFDMNVGTDVTPLTPPRDITANTGASRINANITSSRNQTYATVTLGGSAPPIELTSNITQLIAINNYANGTITIGQSGTLQIQQLRTSTATTPNGSITLGALGQTVGTITTVSP